jgi:CRP-like cAMP-binding protein
MSIDDDVAFMERIPLLGLLGRAALRVLAIGSDTRRLSAGDVLFVAGERADAGYVIQEGSFSLLPGGAVGAAQEAKATRGALLGEFALITETVRPATATALEPATVIRISRTLFLKMLDGYPDAARRLRDSLIARAEQSARDVERVREAFGKVDQEPR